MFFGKGLSPKSFIPFFFANGELGAGKASKIFLSRGVFAELFQKKVNKKDKLHMNKLSSS